MSPGVLSNILIATTDQANSLTIFNATTGSYGLHAGFMWFVIGFVLIIVYQVYAHYVFWGKVPITEQRLMANDGASVSAEYRLPLNGVGSRKRFPKQFVVRSIRIGGTNFSTTCRVRLSDDPQLC